MQVSVSELPESAAQLDIKLEAERIARAFDDVYQELAQMLRVPGFRPGKAPRWRLRNELGEEKVQQAAWDLIATEVLRESIELSGLDVVDIEEPEEVRPQEGQPLELTVRVIRRPQPKLAPHQGLRLRRVITEPTEEEVEERIEALRQAAATEEDTDRDYVVAGDSVYVEMKIRWPDAEEPWEEGTEVLIADQGTYTPPLDRYLVGRKLDETFMVQEEYPDDYDDEELASKALEFAITVSDIKARQVPGLDDEFARKAGGVETVDELRSRVREQITEEREKLARADLSRQVVEHLTDTTAIELPPRIVQSLATERAEEFRSLVRAYGLQPDAILASQGVGDTELESLETEIARRQLTLLLAVEAIAEQEGIEVQDDELPQEAVRQTKDRGLDPQDLALESMDGDQLQALRLAVRRQKVIDRIIELAEIEEVPLEELAAELGTESEEHRAEET